ncbi:MAG: hypothetical protein P8X55_16725, partial [Desulfosarcinaceae bacterium]
MTDAQSFHKIVSIQKWLFPPISLLGGKFNPRNINHMPAVKISARLKLDENISFLDGHKIVHLSNKGEYAETCISGLEELLLKRRFPKRQKKTFLIHAASSAAVFL